jgi:ArsR family transcriptional regulator
MRELKKVFKILSDESRLRVLLLLQDKECCVCEVMQALDISQSKASRILGALYDIGFLKLRKDGLWSLYSMNWDGMNIPQKDILKTTIKAYGDNEQTLIDREHLKRAERVGPRCAEKVRSNKASV